MRTNYITTRAYMQHDDDPAGRAGKFDTAPIKSYNHNPKSSDLILNSSDLIRDKNVQFH